MLPTHPIRFWTRRNVRTNQLKKWCNHLHFPITESTKKSNLPFSQSLWIGYNQKGFYGGITMRATSIKNMEPFSKRKVSTPLILPKPNTVSQPSYKLKVLGENCPTRQNALPKTTPMCSTNGLCPPPTRIHTNFCHYYTTPKMIFLPSKTPKPFAEQCLITSNLTPKPPFCLGLQTLFQPTKWCLNSSSIPPSPQENSSSKALRLILLNSTVKISYDYYIRTYFVSCC